MNLYKHFSANNIELDPFDFKTELAMESYIIENENILQLESYDTVGIIDYELPIKGGRKRNGTDGRIDLLALYDHECLGIIELKNDQLSMDHYDQLNDYFGAKEEIEKSHPELIKNNKTLNWVGILVGTDIKDELRKKVENNELFIQNDIPLVLIIIKRFRSKDGQMYIIADSVVSSKSKSFDHSKYIFNNQEYGKGRLALAVVKEYVRQNPDITLGGLQKIFDKKTLKTGYTVIAEYNNAKDIFERSKGLKYHFLNEDEIIYLENGQKIAVCNDWTIYNIDNFIKVARNLGYKIAKKE
jgi:hypothetical protein